MPFPASCYLPVGAPVQGSGSIVFALTQAGGSKAVAISVLTNAVYWTFDGSTPSSTNGLVLQASVSPLLWPVGPGGEGTLTHKFLATTGTAVVNLQALGN